ncbi:MAG: lipoate--protein ligase family protein [Simkaniaceae bacterium]
MWKILDTGKRPAADNMHIDSELLRSLKPYDSPILHFYEWEGLSATYGYFTKIDRFFDIPKAKKIPMHFAKRPTGGGIIFHIWDLAFSVLLPSGHKSFSINTLENYRRINDAVLEAVKIFFNTKASLLPSDPVEEGCAKFFCMAKPTVYDVMHEGKKIAGASQRRQKQGLLHQGSISLASPKWDLLEEILLPEAKILEAMRRTSYYILGPGWTEKQLGDLRLDVREQIKKTITAI